MKYSHHILRMLQIFSTTILMAALLLVGYLVLYEELDMVDALLISFCTIVCYVAPKLKINAKIKLCVLIVLFLIYYMQFLNINTSIKYWYPAEDWKNIRNVRYQYFLYGLCMLYTFYQQWLTLSEALLNANRYGRYTFIGMICLFLILFILLLICPSLVYDTNSLLYYVPVAHYIILLGANIMSHKKHLRIQ